jgi:hypothetical protein
VSSGERIACDDRVSETIGWSFGSKRVRIGSSISCGRSARICDTASRMSCVACCRSFSKLNSTRMVPKPSSDCEVTRSTPLIPAIASSIGSTTSRSTMSGEAPGYGTATLTMGGLTSGNSSVSRFHSANRPNTTSASIVTTVTTGFLMAKSEMNMARSPLPGRGAAPRRAPVRELRRGADRRAHQHGVARRQPRDHLHAVRLRVARA